MISVQNFTPTPISIYLMMGSELRAVTGRKLAHCHQTEERFIYCEWMLIGVVLD